MESKKKRTTQESQCEDVFAAPPDPSYYGLMFVLDCSGSMNPRLSIRAYYNFLFLAIQCSTVWGAPPTTVEL